MPYLSDMYCFWDGVLRFRSQRLLGLGISWVCSDCCYLLRLFCSWLGTEACKPNSCFGLFLVSTYWYNDTGFCVLGQQL
ncbi:unnamed protein product, partial [Heterosigma akashiwo]